MQDITVEEMLHKGYSNLIDVRSPGEFAKDTIPGAYNVPLFSDAERAQVGIRYKQEGQASAQWLGMQIVSPKMETILQTIRERSEQLGEKPTIFCWRGGLRSRAMATFATFAGIPVQRLIGGYRAYRKHVVSVIEPYELRVPVYLLHGMTGVGKTELLHRLEARNVPVLDLERMAGHRGSVFGHLGKGKPANQKMFDARLFEAMRRYADAPFLLMEAESKRVGNAILPAFLMQAKETARHIYLTAPLDVRVQRLYDEYVTPLSWRPDYQAKVLDAFQSIARKIPTEHAAILRDAIKREEYKVAIAILLVHYYDLRYENKLRSYTGGFQQIDATSLEHAEKQILAFMAEQSHQ